MNGIIVTSLIQEVLREMAHAERLSEGPVPPGLYGRSSVTKPKQKVAPPPVPKPGKRASGDLVGAGARDYAADISGDIKDAFDSMTADELRAEIAALEKKKNAAQQQLKSKQGLNPHGLNTDNLLGDAKK
jgi:hypothetical protein